MPVVGKYSFTCQKSMPLAVSTVVMRIVAPAAAGLAGSAAEHDGFSLREVTWRIGCKTSGITNAREDSMSWTWNNL